MTLTGVWAETVIIYYLITYRSIMQCGDQDILGKETH